MWFRNFSNKKKKMQAADSFAVSIPKSGRTWLRYLLHQYWSMKEDVEFDLDVKHSEIPDVYFTHDIWEHVTSQKKWDQIRGKHLIPANMRNQYPVVILARDLRDVCVSLFFQVTKRENLFTGDISKMLRDDTFGIERIIAMINLWHDDWNNYKDLYIWSYEEAKKDPFDSFSKVIGFLDSNRIDRKKLLRAIEHSNFSNMRKAELSNDASNKALVPGDKNDKESYKVRRGKVHGYHDYLSVEDISLIENACQKLPTDWRSFFLRDNLPQD
jgi:hypothetical protein